MIFDIIFSNLTYWLSIFFVIPFRSFEVFWIILPIWIAFVFTDLFQERSNPSFGNVITNGAIMLWVGVDWIRVLIESLLQGQELFTFSMIVKFIICLVLIYLGIIVITNGIKKKRWVKKIGAAREKSYIMLIFTPVIYGVVSLTLQYFLVVVIFFPIFYYVFELVNKFTPNINVK